MSGQFLKSIHKLSKETTLLLSKSWSSATINKSTRRLVCQPSSAFSTSNVKFASSGSSDSSTASTTSDVDPTNVSGKKKYWKSYGYDFKSEEEDRKAAHFVMFVTTTIGFVFFGFCLAYMPDNKYSDWSQREAYIEIARREALGLPHIDPNLVPPENVNLPTEEELADFEIII